VVVAGDLGSWIPGHLYTADPRTSVSQSNASAEDIWRRNCVLFARLFDDLYSRAVGTQLARFDVSH